MRRSVLTSLVGGCLAALLVAGAALCLISDVGAQGKSGAATAARTKAEQRAITLLDKNRLLTARRVADEILKDNQESMVGHYVLGRVLHEADGSLARAMYHLGHSREIYEMTYKAHPRPPDAPWQFHRELLFSIQKLAAQLEEHKYQLEILDYHDALYSPDLTAEHAWPLMRLGRFDEARKFAGEAARSKEAQQRSLGLNTLCAVEGEARTRKKYYQACLASLTNARAEDRGRKLIDKQHGSTLAVHAYNAALAARAAFKPEQAEKFAIEGTTRLAFTPANPWRFLTRLYTDQGRMSDAVNSLREMQRWRTQQPPHVRVQARAETDVAFATVLLVAARTDVALPVVDRALDRPDRRGLSSVSPERTMGAHALLRRAMRRTHAQLLAERATWTPAGEPTRSLLRRAERMLRSRVDALRITNVLGDDTLLVETFRPFTSGGMEPVPVWLLGDLVQVLGPGVVGVVLRKARELDRGTDAGPYHDAVEAEVALARGDRHDAVALAQEALRKLPRREALLRARAAAVGAEAARQNGDQVRWLRLLGQAMQIDPSVVRRLSLRLPATVAAGAADPAANLARQLLARSPRLDLDSGVGQRGFRITIRGRGPALEACLRGPHGARLSCARAPARKPKKGKDGKPVKLPKLSNEQRAARLVEAFHQQCLAMPLGLTGTDLNSLDGSTTVAEQAVRRKLGGILDMAIKERK